MIYQSKYFALDVESFTLVREGVTHHLEPQVFDLLVYLIENRDRVVTRDELLDNLWQGRIVSENTLNGSLKALRKAVGDDGKSQKIVRTIHRRGYQFVDEIVFDHQDEAIPADQSTFIDPAPTANVGGDNHSGTASIAVLPFDNLSNDPDQQYFSDGITENIITELSRFNSLFVISRESSFLYNNRAANTGDAGKDLNVTYLIKGSVQKAGNRVRVFAQLVEAESGSQLWAERFDRELEDIFDVQDEVVSNITMMASGRVEVADLSKSARKPTNSISAYELVLRADWLFFNEVDADKAVQLLKKAIEIDPKYAMAHARLAELAAWEVFTHGKELDTVTPIVKEHGETATGLEPKDGIVNAILGEAYGMVGEHKLSAYHANVAMESNPNAFLVMAFSGWVKACQGDHDAACNLLETAMRNDPYSAIGLRENKIDAYYMARRYEDCAEQITGWPNPPLHTQLPVAAALAQLGKVEEAQTLVKKIIAIAPKNLDLTRVCRAYQNMCAHDEDGEHWINGFRKAGIDL